MPNDDLYIEQLECGPMANFVYLVGSKRTREVAIVDPAWEIDGLLEPICHEGRLPGMGDEADYREFLANAGFEEIEVQHLGPRVRKTWSIVIARLVKRLFTDAEARRFLLRGPESRIFGLSILRIWVAYRLGVMRYALFTARKSGRD